MSSWLQASGMWPDGIVAKFELELGRGHLYTAVFQEGWGSSPGRHDLILSYKMIGKGIWFWISGSLSAQRGRFAFFFFSLWTSSLQSSLVKDKTEDSVWDGLTMVLSVGRGWTRGRPPRISENFQDSGKLRLLFYIPPIYFENGQKWHLVSRMYLPLQNLSPGRRLGLERLSPLSILSNALRVDTFLTLQLHFSAWPLCLNYCFQPAWCLADSQGSDNYIWKGISENGEGHINSM